MKIGLLWFDDDPKRDVVQKIQRAAAQYRKKFGRPPTACYVHPSLLEKERRMRGLKVVPTPSMLQHHFWVGEEET